MTLPPISLLGLLVVLVALATHRVTRLLTYDKFPPICAPREAFVQRWGVYMYDAQGNPLSAEEKKISIGGKQTNAFMRSLAYLWECDWCMSIWVGSGLTYLTWRWTETMIWILIALAASGITGLVASTEKRD